MKITNRYIFPVFFLASIAGLLMKKFTVPFHGLFLIIIFDGLAILYFLRAFSSEKHKGVVHGRSFNFDLSSIVYAICSIAILYRLQYWEGWNSWIHVAGILFVLVSALTIFSIRIFIKLPERKMKIRSLLIGHISWFYFLLLFPPVALMNPRTFHNFFNGTTYEQYVRTRFPMDEGTAMLETYMPSGRDARNCSDQYFREAETNEKSGDYKTALEDYDQAIDLNPENAKAIYQRGRLKLTKLDIDKEMAQSAHDDFSRAIQLDSTMSAAYYHRAVVHNYLNKKNRAPAQRDFRHAQELDTSLRQDHFINEFLALPPIDSSRDTTTYINLDEQ